MSFVLRNEAPPKRRLGCFVLFSFRGARSADSLSILLSSLHGNTIPRACYIGFQFRIHGRKDRFVMGQHKLLKAADAKSTIGQWETDERRRKSTSTKKNMMDQMTES